MDIKKVFDNNIAWINDKLKNNAEYFNELNMGQQPQMLYIGCSDSRVTAEELMGLGPGEVFVHRNIANMINNIDLSAMSVINYAVNVLKVKHLVVCGHYNCGGVKAAMRSENMGLLNPWLRGIRDVYRIHKEELNSIENESVRYNRLVELNVIEQCINATKTSDVQLAIRRGDLTVHGWVVDLSSGKIIDLNFNYVKANEEIREIYHLD